jgi:predicted dehydrogenase
MASELQTRPRKRYALIGTGGRAIFFYTAIAQDYKTTSEVVAFTDTNQTRMNYANQKLQSLGHTTVPTYLASDFDKMIRDTKPDEVIVTTMDRTHHIYVSASGRNVKLACVQATN